MRPLTRLRRLRCSARALDGKAASGTAARRVVVRQLAHQVNNALFPLQLAAAILERQHGPNPQLDTIRRAGRAAIERVEDAVQALTERAPPSVASSDLGASWAPVAEAAREAFPGRAVDAEIPSVEVGVSADVVRRLLALLLGNALRHGGDGPVTVRCSKEGAALVIANPGALPFADLASLEALRHRSPCGLGVGLVLARELAATHGVGLALASADGLVTATLTLPRPVSER